MTIAWQQSGSYEDVIYETAEGIAKVTINRPRVRNAFRPQTVSELQDAFRRAHDDDEVGVVILTGAGDKAFCSGGDQGVRGPGDKILALADILTEMHELKHHYKKRIKPDIAMVAGY